MPEPPTWTKFALAGIGGFSGWCFVHPFDVIKVRSQLIGETLGPGDPKPSITSVAKVKERFTDEEGNIPFMAKAGTALVSGGVASFVCCPVEVVLVRMQADSRLPEAQRRGYTNPGNALVRIAREEGVQTYWRGAVPTMVRASVVAMTQLATYDQAKDVWKSMLGLAEGTGLHLLSGVTSGFIYSAVSLPLDTAKTRSQAQKPLPDGTLRYNGLFHTIKSIAAEEGALSLWRGFPAYFLRGGGHTVMMFVILEKILRNVFHNTSDAFATCSNISSAAICNELPSKCGC
eukprot:gene14460-3539_t